MSLSIGELTGYVSLDVRDVDRGVSRTGQAMARLRGQMTADGDRAGLAAGQALGDGLIRATDGSLRDARGRFVTAGRQAGDSFGDGLTRGADGQLTNLRGRFVTGGRQAGDGFGDGLTDGVRRGADDAEGEATGMMGRLKLAAAGAGVAIGGVLMEGFGQALEQGKITGRLGAQLGATPAVAQRYGQIAGKLYAQAVTEDFQTAADTIRAVMSAGLLPPDATNAQIESISTRAADLANTFDVDVTLAAQAAGSMIKNGLAKNGQQAFDLLATGMKGLGPAGEDLMETFSEYGPIFKAAGISGQTALGLIRQGIEGGWVKDTDKIADAFKEFNLRATEGSDGVKEAFKTLGLNAKQTGDDIAAGGKRGEKAMGMVLDRLRKLGAGSQEAKQIVSTLFGGPGEDLGAALFSLDIGKASKSMDGAEGSAKRLGEGLRSGPAVQMEQFKRQAMQGLVTFLGGKVIPALTKMFGYIRDHSGEFKVVGTIITGVLIPALVLMGIAATVRSAQVVAGWVRSGAAAVASAGRHTLAAGRVVLAWTRMAGAAVLQGARIAAAAVASAARTAAAWALTAARMTGQFLVAVIRVAAVTVAQFALMAARAVAWAATMAAQWLIAMGPIGWIILTVTALVALIIAKWDTVKAVTLSAWSAIRAWIVAAVNGVVEAVGWLSVIPGRIAEWFGRALAAAVAKFNSLLSAARAVPGRVIGALSSLGGMLWSSVSGAGSRMVSAISAKVNSAVSTVRGLPGRARSALGSLGSTLYNSGRALISGFISGITSKAGELYGKARSLVSKVRNLFPFSPAKEGPFAGRGYTLYSGRALMGDWALGITQQQGAVTAAMARVAQAGQDALNGAAPALTVGQGGTAALTSPRSGTPDAQAGGSAAQQQTPVVRVIVDATGGGDDLTRWLRKTVRVQGRGNVQVAFGGS
ncbi:phage tail tape measure protein [Streptomyces malaysiensis]|uniref:phage tail tape measure protein n=1 Tax=Streptomyces malaysiensis TaxID=92644 RepID=UPI0011CD5866|nr:phage tail tape measure protein [Streptomyces malaysiensis]